MPIQQVHKPAEYGEDYPSSVSKIYPATFEDKKSDQTLKNINCFNIQNMIFKSAIIIFNTVTIPSLAQDCYN